MKNLFLLFTVTVLGLTSIVPMQAQNKQNEVFELRKGQIKPEDMQSEAKRVSAVSIMENKMEPDIELRFKTSDTDAFFGKSQVTITYDSNDEPMVKYVRKDNWLYEMYLWDNGAWIYSDTWSVSGRRINAYPPYFEKHYSGTYGFSYPTGRNTGTMILLWDSEGNKWITDENEIKRIYNPKYNSNGNLISYGDSDWQREISYQSFTIEGEVYDRPLLIQDMFQGSPGGDKYTYQYDANGMLTIHEEYSWDWEKEIWKCTDDIFTEYGKEVNQYTVNNNVLSTTGYKADEATNKWVESVKREFKYNSDYSKETGVYEYKWENNGWALDEYTLHYYESNASDIEIGSNVPVGNENQGSFDLNVNIPMDDIKSGSISITFPEGFSLDEENSGVVSAYAGNFELKIVKRDNVTYLLEVKRKTLLNALLSNNESTAMLQITYSVDEKLERGTYDISVYGIHFETNDGDFICKSAETVSTELTRWGVGNEGIEDANVSVYITNHTIYIQTSQAEEITIYNMNGSKLYEATVPSGTTTIDASAFPQGVLIVKGSSGWVKKVVR